LLIFFSLDTWIFDCLNIKAGYLNLYFCDWQNGFDFFYQPNVRIQFVPDTRG